MSQPKLPILKSVFAGYAFLAANWQRVLMVGAPYLLSAIGLVWLQSMMAPAAAVGPSATSGLLAFVLTLVNMVASIVFATAVLRLAVRNEFMGWNGMQLGADEARIFVVNILVAVLTVLVLLLGGLFALAFVSAMAAGIIERANLSQEAVTENIQLVFDQFSATDWAMVVLLGLGFVALMLWLAARLSMALPATIERRKVQILAVWPMSKGQSWRIALAIGLTGLPVLVVGMLAYEAVSSLLGVRLLELAHTVDSSVENSEMIVRMNEVARLNGFLAIVTVPLFSGLYAFIYNGLKQVSPVGDAAS
jgi:hypothetical protein